ncbi:hypothetical protein PIB30_034773 [Stylosanthes scabra]|uniref:Uncharacterized protein n=1 Tax=Stylosanthes scabra TaxID=79078 RepID=A0ABU6RD00_9FABA|nr:hypothetical protein [Stylosanthes scabra]
MPLSRHNVVRRPRPPLIAPRPCHGMALARSHALAKPPSPKPLITTPPPRWNVAFTHSLSLTPQNPRHHHAWARWLSPLTTPRCGREAQSTPGSSCNVIQALITAHDCVIITPQRELNVTPPQAPQSPNLIHDSRPKLAELSSISDL